jgi:hypothetical protein
MKSVCTANSAKSESHRESRKEEPVEVKEWMKQERMFQFQYKKGYILPGQQLSLW